MILVACFTTTGRRDLYHVLRGIFCLFCVSCGTASKIGVSIFLSLLVWFWLFTVRFAIFLPLLFFLMLFRILGEILCLGTWYVIIGFGSASPLWLCFFSFSFVGYLVLYIYTYIYLFVCVLLWLLFCLLILTVGWLVGLRGG